MSHLLSKNMLRTYDYVCTFAEQNVSFELDGSGTLDPLRVFGFPSFVVLGGCVRLGSFGAPRALDWLFFLCGEIPWFFHARVGFSVARLVIGFDRVESTVGGHTQQVRTLDGECQLMQFLQQRLVLQCIDRVHECNAEVVLWGVTHVRISQGFRARGFGALD